MTTSKETTTIKIDVYICEDAKNSERLSEKSEYIFTGPGGLIPIVMFLFRDRRAALEYTAPQQNIEKRRLGMNQFLNRDDSQLYVLFYRQ